MKLQTREWKSGRCKYSNQSCILYGSNWCHYLWRIFLLQGEATQSFLWLLLCILTLHGTKSSFLVPPGQDLCPTLLLSLLSLKAPWKVLGTKLRDVILIPVTFGSTARKGLGLCMDGVFCYSPFGQTHCFVDFFPFSPKILGHPQAILKDYKWLIKIPALSCAAARMTFNNSSLVIQDNKNTHWCSTQAARAPHTHI